MSCANLRETRDETDRLYVRVNGLPAPLCMNANRVARYLELRIK